MGKGSCGRMNFRITHTQAAVLIVVGVPVGLAVGIPVGIGYGLYHGGKAGIKAGAKAGAEAKTNITAKTALGAKKLMSKLGGEELGNAVADFVSNSMFRNPFNKKLYRENKRRISKMFKLVGRNISADGDLAKINAKLLLHPRDAALHLQKGSLLLVKSMFQPALKAFNRAIECSPSQINYEAWFFAGLCYLRHEPADFNAANEAFGKAVSQLPPIDGAQTSVAWFARFIRQELHSSYAISLYRVGLYLEALEQSSLASRLLEQEMEEEAKMNLIKALDPAAKERSKQAGHGSDMSSDDKESSEEEDDDEHEEDEDSEHEAKEIHQVPVHEVKEASLRPSEQKGVDNAHNAEAQPRRGFWAMFGGKQRALPSPSPPSSPSPSSSPSSPASPVSPASPSSSVGLQPGRKVQRHWAAMRHANRGVFFFSRGLITLHCLGRSPLPQAAYQQSILRHMPGSYTVIADLILTYLHFDEQGYVEALHDFARAGELGCDTNTCHMLRAIAFRKLGLDGDAYQELMLIRRPGDREEEERVSTAANELWNTPEIQDIAVAVQCQSFF